MVKSRQFTRCMGRWLMTLVLVMLTSLAMRAAEAYACYTSSHTTLTFYYDNYRSSRSGTTYNLPESGNYPGWMSDYTNKSVTRVVFNSSFAQTNPYSTSYWFYGMVKLTSITGMNQYLRTLLVTDMSYMFCQCSKLTSVDVSSFNTSTCSICRLG